MRVCGLGFGVRVAELGGGEGGGGGGGVFGVSVFGLGGGGGEGVSKGLGKSRFGEGPKRKVLEGFGKVPVWVDRKRECFGRRWEGPSLGGSKSGRLIGSPGGL